MSKPASETKPPTSRSYKERTNSTQDQERQRHGEAAAARYLAEMERPAPATPATAPAWDPRLAKLFVPRSDRDDTRPPPVPVTPPPGTSTSANPRNTA